MKNKTKITKQGFYRLKQEYQELKEVKKPKAVKRLQRARNMGDLSENSEYQTAKEELMFIEQRIAELEQVIKNAAVIDKKQTNTVQIGNWVVVENQGNQQRFLIVGDFEANPNENKLSHTSPLGRALIGKKSGAKVTVEAPKGKSIYKIIDIE